MDNTRRAQTQLAVRCLESLNYRCFSSIHRQLALVRLIHSAAPPQTAGLVGVVALKDLSRIRSKNRGLTVFDREDDVAEFYGRMFFLHDNHHADLLNLTSIFHSTYPLSLFTDFDYLLEQCLSFVFVVDCMSCFHDSNQFCTLTTSNVSSYVVLRTVSIFGSRHCPGVHFNLDPLKLITTNLYFRWLLHSPVCVAGSNRGPGA